MAYSAVELPHGSRDKSGKLKNAAQLKARIGVPFGYLVQELNGIVRLDRPLGQHGAINSGTTIIETAHNIGQDLRVPRYQDRERRSRPWIQRAPCGQRRCSPKSRPWHRDQGRHSHGSALVENGTNLLSERDREVIRHHPLLAKQRQRMARTGQRAEPLQQDGVAMETGRRLGSTNRLARMVRRMMSRGSIFSSSMLTRYLEP
jgi:hypothetical protein